MPKSKGVAELRKAKAKLKKTINREKEEIASQGCLIAALKEALGEFIQYCPKCGGYVDIIAWNSDMIMRKCSNGSCRHSLRPLPGIPIKKVVEIEVQLLGRQVSE